MRGPPALAVRACLAAMVGNTEELVVWTRVMLERDVDPWTCLLTDQEAKYLTLVAGLGDEMVPGLR